MNKESNIDLNIGWLYPTLMSTYGDRGNIITLVTRCGLRGITTRVHMIDLTYPAEQLTHMDILFMGGAQDKQQELVSGDMQSSKGKYVQAMIERGTPSLFICGAYQFMGQYYRAADGTKIPCLGIFDFYTQHPGPRDDRLIGNIVVESSIGYGGGGGARIQYVGFENHGGRTYLGNGMKPFAQVVVGHGNNGKDKTEGFIHKGSVGTYLHGPILPKNPELADHLISHALVVKGRDGGLESLDDVLAHRARKHILDTYR